MPEGQTDHKSPRHVGFLLGNDSGSRQFLIGTMIGKKRFAVTDPV
jgi:hypothetical protein